MLAKASPPIAAQLPFAAVVGVEFSRELCAIGTENIRRIVPEKRVAGRVECHYGDVTAYALPEMPLVCYFYNPFDQVIMQAVVDKLTASLKHQPRDIYIIYVHPEHRALFDASGYWDVVDESHIYIVYHARINDFSNTCHEETA